MIETIKTGNVRGIDRAHTLGRRTLICGPNGAGKSTVAISAYLALQGFVPGSDKQRAVANMPDCQNGEDIAVMAPVVIVDGKSVRRTWTSDGSKISIRANVNGVEGDRNSAAGLVEAVFGPDPLLLDMETFWGLSPAEKRRTVLGLTCSPERQKELLTAEKKARDAANRAREDRHGAEKHLQETAKSLAAAVQETAKRLAAAPDKVRAGLETLVANREELVTRVETAKAGDKLRKQKASLLERIKDGTVKVDAVKEALATSKKDLKSAMAKFKKLRAEPECPTVYMLEDEARDMLLEIDVAFTELGVLLLRKQALELPMIDKKDVLGAAVEAKGLFIRDRLNQLLHDL